MRKNLSASSVLYIIKFKKNLETGEVKYTDEEKTQHQEKNYCRMKFLQYRQVTNLND